MKFNARETDTIREALELAADAERECARENRRTNPCLVNRAELRIIDQRVARFDRLARRIAQAQAEAPPP